MDIQPTYYVQHPDGSYSVADPQPVGAVVADHILREVVNDLRDTAIQFHDTQQLRERLRHCLDPLLAAALASQPAKPAEVPPAILKRTEEIRLAMANPVALRRTKLIGFVECLLGHIAFTNASSEPAEVGGVADEFIKEAIACVEYYEGKALADKLRTALAAQTAAPQISTKCTLPPEGWYCTRASGHDGPCAAHPKQESNYEQKLRSGETHQGDAQDGAHDAGGTGYSVGTGAHKHNEHRTGQSATDQQNADGYSSGVRVSGEGKVYTEVTIEPDFVGHPNCDYIWKAGSICKKCGNVHEVAPQDETLPGEFDTAEALFDAMGVSAAPQETAKPVAWRVGVTGNWVYHSTYEDAKKETDDHYAYYGEDAGEYEEPEPLYLAAHHPVLEAAQAVDIAAARKALDNLDDYARMETGVDAIGPRTVLEQFITAVEDILSNKDK